MEEVNREPIQFSTRIDRDTYSRIGISNRGVYRKRKINFVHHYMVYFSAQLEAKKICQYLGIRVKTITGGKTKKMLLDPPIEEVDIVVASFGVISKLTTTKVYKLNMVRHIVLDEADALFHETFEDKLQVFLKRVPVCVFIYFLHLKNII